MVRRLVRRPRDLWRAGRRRLSSSCNLCGRRVRFTGISDDLGATLGRFGFPYSLGDFETLNYKRYLCPRCGSSDRDRLYALFLEREVLNGGEIRLLDIAPSRALRKYLKQRTKVSYRSADLYMRKVDDVVDVTDMPVYPTGSFDFFICSHVVEHVSDDIRAMSELHRVLRPGGRGVLMAPVIDRDGIFDEDPTVTDSAERWRRFGQDDHVRLYDKTTYLRRMREAGFAVREYTHRDLGAVHFIRHGVSLKSVLYVVEKSAS